MTPVKHTAGMPRALFCAYALALLLALASPAPRALASVARVDASLAKLGERLFFDKRLSADGTVSCASCHQPDKAFADGAATAAGSGGRKGTRNTPTLLDAAEQGSFLWDGRRTSLEDQVLDPFFDPAEHGLADAGALGRLVSSDAGYQSEFDRLFPSQGIARATIARSIAAYVRTLSAGPSRFDRHWTGGDPAALTRAEARGFEIFRGTAQCASCHTIAEKGATFSDGKFHSLAVGLEKLGPNLSQTVARAIAATPAERSRLLTRDAAIAALGRFNVTGDPADIGKYRTPTLRNVALTAPYMHDGSVATLEEAVELELYYRSVQQGRPIVLTAPEKADLVAFLRSLTSESLESKQGTP